MSDSELRRQSRYTWMLIAFTAIMFVLMAHQSRAQFTFATDNASNSAYSDGWQSGDNGGSGFTAWSFNNGLNSGEFIGSPSNNGMSTTGIGSTAFGVFGNQNGQYYNATRALSTGLGVGDTLSFWWTMNYDTGAAGLNKGIEFRSGTTNIFSINNSGTSSDITVNGVNTGFGYGTNAMFVTLTRTTNGYTFIMNPDRDGIGGYTNTISSNVVITGFNIYGSGNDNAGQRNVYYNLFAVTNTGVYSTTQTESRALTGAGALVVSNSSTLTLTSDSNNFTGGTTILNGSTLSVGNGGVTGVISGDITNGGAVIFNRNTNISYGGLLSSTGALTINSGTVALGNTNNTFSGNITVNAGAVLSGSVWTTNAAGAFSSFGNHLATSNSASAQWLTLNGGTARYTGAGETNLMGFSVGTGGGTIDSSGTGNIQFKWGSGAVRLVGDQTTARTITFSGTNAGAMTNTGFNQFNGKITNGSGGAVVTVVKTGTGNWGFTYSSGSGYTGGLEIRQGSILVQSGDMDWNAGNAGSALGGGDVKIFDGAGLSSLSSTIRVATTNNTFKLGGTNFLAYVELPKVLLTNNTIVNNGTNVFPTGGIAYSPATANFNTILGSTNGVGELGGSYSLTKMGGGVLTLNGSNSYSGGTIVSGGFLNVTNSGTLGTSSSTVTVSGGTLDLGNAVRTNATFTISSGTLTNGTMSSSTAFNYSGGTIATNAILTGAGTLNMSGGSLTLADNFNGITGGYNLTGGTLILTNAANMGSGNFILGSAGNLGTFQINTTTTLTNRFIVQDSSTNTSINVATNQTFTMSGTISQTNGSNSATKFGKDGAGTLVMAGSNGTYGGQLQIGQGTVIVGVNNALGTNVSTLARGVDLGLNVGDTALANNVSLLISNGVTFGQSIYVATNVSSATRTIGLFGTGASGSFTNEIYQDGDLILDAGSSTGTLTVSGAIVTNVVAVAKGIIVTNGTTVLSGNNNYTGTTTIGAGAALTIGSGGTSGSLGGGNVTNNGALTYNRSDSVTLGNTISGTGTLTKTNSNTLILSGNNTYSGGTLVAGGLLRIGAGGSSGSVSGNITNNGTVTFDRSNDITFGGVISGTGGFQKWGAGTLTLSGVNTMSGTDHYLINGTTLFATNQGASFTGTLTLGDNNGANSAVLALTNGITLANAVIVRAGSSGTKTIQSLSTSGTDTLSGGVTNNDTVFISAGNGGNLVLSGALSGSGNVVKTGGNNLTLSGNSSSYTGGIYIDAGTLVFSSGSLGGSGQALALGDSSTGASAATFTMSGDTLSTDRNIDIRAGVGTRTLNFNNTTGTTNTISGTLAHAKGVTINVANSGATALLSGVISSNTAGGQVISVTGNGTLGVANTGNTTDARWSVGSGATLAIGSSRNLGADPGGYYSDKLTLAGGTLRATNGFSLNANVGIQVSSASTISVDSGLAMTNPAVMGGAGDITKAGAGSLVLSGVNTNTGKWTVSAGTLALSGSGTLGATSSAVTIGAGTVDLGGLSRTNGAFILDTGTLTNGTLSASSYALTNAGAVSAILSGSGALTKSGSGTAVLTAANDYSGGTTISAGSLQLGNGGTSGMINGNITNNGTLIFNRSDSNSFANLVSGTGGITINSGIITLTNTNNSFSGNININNGATLSVTQWGTNASGVASTGTHSQTATTGGSQWMIINGGTIQYVGSGETFGGGITMGTLGATVDASGTGALTLNKGTSGLFLGGDQTTSRTLTLTGNNTGANFLAWNLTNGSGGAVVTVNKTGTGTWRLSGTGNYSGGVDVRQGTIEIGGSSQVGAFGSGTIRIYDGATFKNSGTSVRTTFTNALNLGGTNNLDQLVFGAATTLTNDTVLNITLTNNTGVEFTGSGAIGESGGARSLRKTGSGTLTLSASNSYSGGTTLSTGILNVTGAGTLGSSISAVTVTGGTLDLGNTSQTNGVITISGGVVTNGTLTASGYALTNAGTISAVLAGSGALTKSGSGTSTLSGANTFTGGTTLNAGTLAISANGALGNGSVTIASNATIQGLANLNVSNGISISTGASGTLDVASTFTLTNAGVISGAGSLVKAGAGTLLLASANTYNNSTTISAGTLQLGNAGALGAGSTDLSVGTWLSGGNLDLNGLNLGSSTETIVMNSGTSYITNSSATTAILGGTMFLTNSTANTFAVDSGKDIIVTGSITNGSASRVLVKNGSGSLTFSNDNRNQGNININAGTLKMGHVGALGTNNTTNNVLVAAGATLDLNGYTAASIRTITNAGGTIANSAAGAATWSNAITMTADSTYNAVGNMTLSGALGGAFGLIKTGVGTLTLSGANSYLGTTINAGTVVVAGPSNLGSGAINLAGGTLRQTAASTTFTVGAVTFGGSGELQIAANSTFVSTGAVTVNGSGNSINLMGALGTYTIGNNYDLLTGTSLAGSGAISLKGTAVGGQTIALGSSYNAGRTTYTFTNTSTAYQLSVSGGSAWDLTWNPATSSGTWNTTDTNTPWLNNFDSSETYFAAGDNVTLGSAATIAVDSAGVTAGTMAVTNSSGTVALSGGSIAVASLTKSGSGTVTLSNALAIAGALTNSAGTLSNDSTTAANSLSVSGGTVNLNGAASITNGVTVSGGAVTLATNSTISGGVNLSSGSLALNGANTISGGVTNTGGTLLVGNNGALGNNTLFVSNNGVLGVTNSAVTLLTNAVTVGVGGATVSNSVATTLGGAITNVSGSANLTFTKDGAGTLTVTNALGVSGTTGSVALNVTNGNLVLTGAQKYLTNSQINTGSKVVLDGVTVNGRATKVGGGGTIEVTNSSAWYNTIGNSTISNAVSIGTNSTLTLGTSGSYYLEFVNGMTGGGNLVVTTGGTNRITGVTTLGNITVASGGRLYMNNATASNTVITNNGTLDIGISSSITNITGLSSGITTYGGNISGNGNISISGSQNIYLAGNISGANNVSLDSGSSGTQVFLTGSNSFTGGINFAHASAQSAWFNNSNALGSGTISNSTSTTAKLGYSGSANTADFTFGNAIVTGATNTAILSLQTGISNTVRLGGVISGLGNLKITSSSNGIVYLNNANNTYTGGTEVGTGKFGVGSDGALGATTGAVNFGTAANSYLVVTSNVSFNAARNFTMSAASYTANIDTGANDVTINGTLTGTGGGNLNKLGTGSLTLAGAASYTGTTALSGTLNLGGNSLNNTALTVTTGTLTNGSINVDASSTGITVNGSSTIAANLSGAADLTVNNANATVRLSGNNTISGQINLGSASGQTLEVTSANALSSSANISGSSSQANMPTLSLLAGGNYILSKYKDGNMTFVGTNKDTTTLTFTNTTVGSSISSGSKYLTANGVSVSFNGDLDLAPNIASKNLYLGGNGDFTFNGSIKNTTTNSTTLNKSNTGVVTLNASNSVDNVTITAGVLKVGNNKALGSNSNSVSGGASLVAGNGITVGQNISVGNGGATLGILEAGTATYSGTITIGSAVVTNAATLTAALTNSVADFSLATFAGAGSNNIILTGLGQVKLGSSYGGSIDVSTYTGNFDATTGGTFNFAGGTTAASFNLASNGILSFADSVTQNGNVTVTTGNTGTVSVGSGKTATYNGTLSKNGSTLVLGGGGTHIVNGAITGTSANSDLVVSNSTVTLNSANSYNGPTFVVAGGTLNNGTNNALPTDTALTLGQANETSSTTNTYNLNGRNQTVASVSGAGGAVNVITNSTGSGNLTLNSSVDRTLSNLRIGGDNFTLTKAGNNTLTVGSSSTIGGISTIAIQSGTLLLGAANQIGDTTAITMAGGTLNTGGFGDSVGKLTVSANSTIQGMNSISSGGSAFTFSDVDLSNYSTSSGSTVTFLGSGGSTYSLGTVIQLSTQSANLWTGYDSTSLNNFRTKISFSDANLRAQINFGGGISGTTLTVAAIPEPKVYMAAAGLMMLIGMAEYRRRKKTVSSKA